MEEETIVATEPVTASYEEGELSEMASTAQAPWEGETTISVDGGQPAYRPQTMFAVLPCLMIAIYLAVMVFCFVMMYRFVRATERIASVFEKGIPICKDQSEN